MGDEWVELLHIRPQQAFIETPRIVELTERCLPYIRAGFPVHFQGRAGTGKTSLALHLAEKIGRPIILIYGDEEFGGSDLVGGYFGYRKRAIRDNFVHSVEKVEEETTRYWVDHRLTVACRYGYTLVYDEFTRSRPEANNVLLSVLEERILELPVSVPGEKYIRVHPNFSAIFTSNPEEYTGVYKTQDALRDRMITIELDFFDREAETAITKARSGLSHENAGKVVDLVRDVRASLGNNVRPTIRAAIMIGKVAKQRDLRISANSPEFVRICLDILLSSLCGGKVLLQGANIKPQILGLIQKYC